MSNTGHKGITDMRDWGLRFYRVQVQWNGVREQLYISIENEPDADLLEALAMRDQMEQEMGKPRTERHIRHDGVMHLKQGGVVKWSR